MESNTKQKIKGHFNKRVQSSKNFLFKLIFSHTFVTILLLVLQIGFLLWAYFSLSDISTLFAELNSLLGILLLILIVNSDEENPMYRLAWVIPICAFPMLGVFLYVFGRFNVGGIGVRRRILQREKLLKPHLYTNPDVKAKIAERDKRLSNFETYMENIADAPAYLNCKAKYYALGDDMFPDLLKDLRNAKKFIFIEYFIICRGVVWDTVLEVLKEKAKEGVEVRVLYDGMNSLVNLPYHYPKKLITDGIQAKQFSPIKPVLSTHQNNRDHRKIVVIDGKISYTGGVNLADEYMNLKTRFGHWKDTAIRIEGPATKSFTGLFLQSWDLDEVTVENYKPYIEDVQFEHAHVPGCVIPYGDGPHRIQNVAENVYLKILNEAVDYVHIMTPYLILDNEMMNALIYAAQRGVDVKLILPHIPDKKIAFYIAHTYYPALILQGVQVYEYTAGFVHAKSFVADGDTAVVGSINLDYRSLYLHYECAAYLYQHPVIPDVEKDFQETLLYCEKMTMESYQKFSAGSKILGRIFRLVGPLM